jgi:hypothetical protein
MRGMVQFGRRAAAIFVALAALSGFLVLAESTSAGADTVTFTSASVGTSGSTANFNESGPWTMSWTYDCTAFGSQGVFEVDVNQPSGDLAEDLGTGNEGNGGSGTEYYYDTGQFNLSVISDCSWTISVAPSSGASLSTPVTFSSETTGSTGNPQQFSVGGTWTMSWTYDCTAFGSQGNFIVDINQPAGDDAEDIGPSELGTGSSGTDTYNDTGTFSLDVLSECSWSIAINSAEPPPPTTTTTATPPTTTTTTPTGSGGYDLVGSDGGVFVFGSSSGFHGSLPGIGIKVNNIVGIVPNANDTGYFLVGSDGGVFAFNTTFSGSLPGIGVHVNNIVGIVPNANDAGYFLVGSDGGVFAFNTTYAGSLPGEGIHVNNIVGIAPTADDHGYWVVSSTGTVYPFGDAATFGNAMPTGTKIKGIAATPDSGGYWLVAANGSVYTFGDATSYGSLPGSGIAASNIVALVPTGDAKGYWLIGSNGAVYPYGDAPNQGSLPSLNVSVNNIVGGVPTSA